MEGREIDVAKIGDCSKETLVKDLESVADFRRATVDRSQSLRFI